MKYDRLMCDSCGAGMFLERVSVYTLLRNCPECGAQTVHYFCRAGMPPRHDTIVMVATGDAQE